MKTKLKFQYIILFILLYGYNFSSLKAQINYCWNNENTPTTDWRKTNSLNQWNWTITGINYPVYTAANLTQPSFYVELPYFCSQAPGSGSCGNDNTYQYELIGNNNQDIQPENGWELVLKNFGEPVSTLLPNGYPVANPYFILYNRYTGRLKTYVALVGAHSANSAYIKIKFSSTMGNRALFSHAKPIANTLEDFNPVLVFNTLNTHVVKNNPTDYFWMVSEIQTSYDPCTCMNPDGFANVNSSLGIELGTVTVTNIEASLDGNVHQYFLAQNGTVKPEIDEKTSFFDVAANVAKAGIAGYTTWDGYKNKANAFFTNYKQQYQTKVAREWFEQEIAPYFAGNATPQQMELMFQNFMQTSDGFKKMVGVEGLDKYNSAYSTFKGVASVLPYVGTAIGVFDFLSNGGKENSTVPQASPPMNFNVALKLQGNLTNPQTHASIGFLTPGSPIGSANSNDIPSYNNILGVFNLLKAPNLEYCELKPFRNISKWIAPSEGGSYEYTEDNINLIDASVTDINEDLARNFNQFRIKDDIKYLVNPASHLEVQTIDAAIVLEYEANDNLFIQSLHGYLNKPAMPMYYGLFDPYMSLNDRLENLEKTGIHLEYISADYPASTTSIIRLRTDYVPLTCIKQLNMVLFGGNRGKMFLKLLVKFKRLDADNAEPVTQIITYDLSEKYSIAEKTCTIENAGIFNVKQYFSLNSIGGSNYYKLDEMIYDGVILTNYGYPNFFFQNGGTITFNPGNPNHLGVLKGRKIIIPDNTTFTSNNQVIYASEEIIIGKNITWANNVQIFCGGTISTEPEMIIPPEVLLSLMPRYDILYQCPTTPVSELKATDLEIENVCKNSTVYKNSAGFTKRSMGNGMIRDKSINANTILATYPNPVKDVLAISYAIDNCSDVEILVFDMMGKQVLSQNGNCNPNETVNIEYINMSSLSSGVYMVHLKTSRNELKKKIVKM
jgi:hypothetical protein